MNLGNPVVIHYCGLAVAIMRNPDLKVSNVLG